MRLLSARLIVSLIIGITLVSLCTSYYQVMVLNRGLQKDLERRAEVLGESLGRNVERDLERDAQHTLQKTVQQFANREHLAGLAVYDPQGNPIAVTSSIVPLMASAPAVVLQSLKENHDASAFLRIGSASIHVYALPLHRGDDVIGILAIVHDSGYIRGESLRIWRETFLSALAHVVLIALITLLIVRWSIAGPIARTAHWMRALRTGRGSCGSGTGPGKVSSPGTGSGDFCGKPDHGAFRSGTEARLRSRRTLWTADRLAVHLRSALGGRRLFRGLQSRTLHPHSARKVVEVKVPASGLVTALEPVCACDGTWVAHGSGDADLETVDAHDRLAVPPTIPIHAAASLAEQRRRGRILLRLRQRRTLAALSYRAYASVFRATDWKHYQEVNRKFADALLEEMEDAENPVVLVQDYHFALLPRMIKEAWPDARVAIFWHIPWPNPEAFAICPWQRELVDGLAGRGSHRISHSVALQ